MNLAAKTFTAAALATASQTADAGIIEFDIHALSDSGETASVQVTSLDTNGAVDTSPVPFLGIYDFTPPNYDIQFTFGGQSYDVRQFDVDILNDLGFDRLTFGLLPELGATFNGQALGALTFTLTSQDLAAVASTDISSLQDALEYFEANLANPLVTTIASSRIGNEFYGGSVTGLEVADSTISIYEPETLALLTTGLLAVGWRRRQEKIAQNNVTLSEPTADLGQDDYSVGTQKLEIAM